MGQTITNFVQVNDNQGSSQDVRLPFGMVVIPNVERCHLIQSKQIEICFPKKSQSISMQSSNSIFKYMN